ncbi:MAG: hypothetical protein NXI20_12220 [bacterium]|nr:hypothetical protein [bacterium]
MNFLKGILGITIFIGSLSMVRAQCPPSGGGTFAGNVTITTACTVTGDLELTSKNLTISSGGSLTVTGSFLNSGNGSVTIDGGTLNVSGSFENAGNGTVEVNNSGTLDVGTDYTNGGNGTSDFISGTITIGGHYLNEGNGNIEAGGVVQVGGNFTVNGNGTTTVDGGLTVGGTADLGSKGIDILDGGVLSANAVVSEGAIDVELGGTIYVESGSITGTVNNDPGNLDQDCTNNCCGNNCNIVGDNLNDTGTAILPIELISFNAEQKSNSVILNWSTASEINNDFFTIERSYDGIIFEVIEEVRGAGNSSSTLNYEYQDHPDYNGAIYYRLSQTDYDGTIEVFSPIFLEYNIEDIQLKIFPTMVSSGQDVTIQINGEINQIQLQCIGLNGKVYKMPLSIQNGSVKADCSYLSEGVYSLLGKANGKHFNERVIIKQ